IFCMFIFCYLYFSYLNSNSWKKQSKQSGINQITFNLIFNKGLLVKNKYLIKFNVVKNYYRDELKLLVKPLEDEGEEIEFLI
ncbi:hypothetical protein ACOL3J_11355, partial [Aliarcobacter butzleri]